MTVFTSTRCLCYQAINSLSKSHWIALRPESKQGFVKIQCRPFHFWIQNAPNLNMYFICTRIREMKAGVDLAYILISQFEPSLDFEIWGGLYYYIVYFYVVLSETSKSRRGEVAKAPSAPSSSNDASANSPARSSLLFSISIDFWWYSAALLCSAIDVRFRIQKLNSL